MKTSVTRNLDERSPHRQYEAIGDKGFLSKNKNC